MTKRNRFVCVAVIGVAVVALIVELATHRDGRTVFDSTLGGDFPAFYVAGEILNQSNRDRLYDLQFQKDLYRELMPALANDRILPYASPPFLTILYRPLAALPYAWAFVIWVIVSVGLFVVGLRLVTESRGLDVWLLAFSFEPLVFETCLGGQMAAIGFVALALALQGERRGRPWQTGLALALCWFKLTWLIWFVPALLFGRRWRELAGFVAGTLGLAGFSVWVVGVEGCRAYLGLLRNYATAQTGSETYFQTWKFVDVMSCARLLGGGTLSRPALAIAVTLAAAWGSWLLVRWGRDAAEPWERRAALWSATLTGTCVFNVYWGVYDTVIVLLAVAVVGRRLPAGWLVALWMTPWLSQLLAQTARVQVLTFVLAGLAVYFLTSLSKKLPAGGVATDQSA
ncbi:MAG: glycosyltransferase family 87 protein [Verrucomicrobiota bacterium]